MIIVYAVFCFFTAIGMAAGALILGGWSGAGYGAVAALCSMVLAVYLLGRPPE
ncbi:MAG: hypothetical protein H0X13_15530 [Ramlibacter sp.]|nr:hypothetical protein [Ramlibacter sp.]